MIHIADSGDILFEQLFLTSGILNKLAERARVDKKNLARPFPKASITAAMFGKEPKRTRNGCIREELVGELDDAIDVILLDERFPHFQACGIAVGELSRRHHEPRRAALFQMREKVEHPHRVCITRR